MRDLNDLELEAVAAAGGWDLIDVDVDVKNNNILNGVGNDNNIAILSAGFVQVT